MYPHFASYPMAQCRKKLAASASADPLDVLKTKVVLQTLGHYQAPDWGVSLYPDTALFDAIKAFQKSQGLKVDGVINPDGETEAALGQALTPHRATRAVQTAAQTLQDLGRGGDELLAHITPEEAGLLDVLTDGASINPHTGLLEFGYADFDDGGGYVDDSYSSPDDFDDGYAGGGSSSGPSGPSGPDGNDGPDGGNDDVNGDTGPNETGSPDDPDADEGQDNPGEGKGPNRGGHAPQEQGETLGEDGFSLTGEEEEEESPAAPPDEEGPTEKEESTTPTARAPTSPPGQYTGTAQVSQTISNIQAASVPEKHTPITPGTGFIAQAIVDMISAIGSWLDRLEQQQSKENQKATDRFEKHHQRFDPSYQHKGVNFGTKRSNPRGKEASRAAVRDALGIQSAIRGGQVLQGVGAITPGPGGKIIGGAGALLEERGKQSKDGYLSDDYSPLGKSEDDEDRW